MAFGGFDRGAGERPMAEINMIPLIDVMLVLLVIFIVTAPLLTHAVKLDLPKATSQPNQTKADHIQLGVGPMGTYYWNGETVDQAALAPLMREAAHRDPQPELHIHADGAAPYRFVAEAMAEASKAGLGRIGFVSDPAVDRP
jgi:biopolymer transport protein ExbD